MGVQGVRIPLEVRRAVRARVAEGVSLKSVRVEFGIARGTVWRLLNEDDPMLSSSCRRSSRFLAPSERETISRELARGTKLGRIATILGRHRSSVTREVAANGGREAYRVVDAEARACGRARRPKATKLETHQVLADTVTQWMQDEQWSPEQISARLRVEFPDDETMRVAKETIYQELFVYGRGGLKKELTKHLRTHRAKRRPRSVTARNKTSSPICSSRCLMTVEPSPLPKRYSARSRPCRSSCASRSPGTKALRWPPTPSSRSPQISPSTSVTRTPRGSVAATRTSMDSFANTCPKAPTCPGTRKPTST